MHLAASVDALVEAAYQPAIDQGPGFVGLDGIALLVVGQARPATVAAARREERVFESARGEETGGRKRAIDDGVLGDGSAVQEQARAREHVGHGGAEGRGGHRERTADALEESRRRGERLAQADPALAVDDDAVGAGAAYVDADDAVGHRMVPLSCMLVIQRSAVLDLPLEQPCKRYAPDWLFSYRKHPSEWFLNAGILSDNRPKGPSPGLGSNLSSVRAVAGRSRSDRDALLGSSTARFRG